MRKDVPTFVLFVREINGYRFEWQGGQYIEVFSRVKPFPRATEELWITRNTIRDPGWYATEHTINVYDGTTGKMRITVSKAAFDREVDKWMKTNK